ncbi:Asparagine synthetase [glutamine-hydrolyzing] 1 [BD1-7 clade bacterium]|uniref:asparagine synthase (glutamine-hydrolyzing) n=1 Tax=BD1-7 clade bacterium TaxID=2029982 RepID=A0A5S9MWE0_9GAMM|nr:Asparagine synthetase [glutamine-hydrolyzing] 1 [BD1-7 clade bacterium]
MCGFAGFLSPKNTDYDAASVLEDMVATLRHRGPDSSGHLRLDLDAEDLFLGHSRLAIQDLSEAGHQPMASAGNRFSMVFNGEIYNHLELRKEFEKLADIEWRGHSDTETLLVGFELIGIRGVIEKTVGMFALAVFDHKLQKLYLIRDRFGEKPLYYGWQGTSFIFASELKAFRKHPQFSPQIDREALTAYFRYNYVPGSLCIYLGLKKLTAGSILTLDIRSRELVVDSYWSPAEAAAKAQCSRFSGSEDEAIDQLESLFRSSVQSQMLSDVPLGAFLSGGVDSSAVVSMMQQVSEVPVHTFSIGFNEEGFNEAVHAKAVAEHLGTLHTELYVSADDALKVIPELPFIFDEPFADSSQIPMYLVARLAREHVTVALSGDGGDELFGGYNRYLAASQLWQKLEKLPLPIRNAAGYLMTRVSPDGYDRLFALLPGFKRVPQAGLKIHKAARALKASSIGSLYLGLISGFDDPASLVIQGKDAHGLTTLNAEYSDVEKMMLWDAEGYLTDDILVKVDRAGMGVSLEGRIPLLDHRIFEFAWSLPESFKIKGSVGKWILRQLLYRHVPQDIIERPKAGFALPIAEWLRGPLKQWAESSIDREVLCDQGYLDCEVIQRYWQEHQAGRYDWSRELWSVLVFQQWLAEQEN